MSLHDKNGLGKKYRKKWCCVMILVHLKKFEPRDQTIDQKLQLIWYFLTNFQHKWTNERAWH